MNIFQVFFMCSLICLMILGAGLKFIRKDSLSHIIKTSDRTYIYGATFSFISLCSLLYALRFLNLTVATSIAYIKPLVVILLAILFLGEKLTIKCTAAFILGALGAYVIAKPAAVNSEQDLALAYACIPAIGWALYDFTLKKQAMRHHWSKQAFMTALASTIISLPFGMLNWKPISKQQWLLLVALGLFSTVNKIAITNAMSRIPLVMLMPIDFTRLIFISTSAYLFLGEKLAVTTILGCCLIAVATFIIAYPIRKTPPVLRS